jgi:hypothetical protein
MPIPAFVSDAPPRFRVGCPSPLSCRMPIPAFTPAPALPTFTPAFTPAPALHPRGLLRLHPRLIVPQARPGAAGQAGQRGWTVAAQAAPLRRRLPATWDRRRREHSRGGGGGAVLALCLPSLSSLSLVYLPPPPSISPSYLLSLPPSLSLSHSLCLMSCGGRPGRARGVPTH